MRKKRRKRRVRGAVLTVLAVGLLTTGLIGYSEGWFAGRVPEVEPPREVAEIFLNAVEDNDSTVAYQFASQTCKEQLRLLFEVRTLSTADPATYTIVDDYIAGDYAYVNYRRHQYGSSDEQVLNMNREGQKWVVSCSKETL